MVSMTSTRNLAYGNFWPLGLGVWSDGLALLLFVFFICFVGDNTGWGNGHLVSLCLLRIQIHGVCFGNSFRNGNAQIFMDDGYRMEDALFFIAQPTYNSMAQWIAFFRIGAQDKFISHHTGLPINHGVIILCTNNAAIWNVFGEFIHLIAFKWKDISILQYSGQRQWIGRNLT